MFKSQYSVLYKRLLWLFR